MVPEAGIEPARDKLPRDFKSFDKKVKLLFFSEL